MQLLTASQVRQLQLTAEAAYDALVLVEDAFCHTADRVLVLLTSDRALSTYKTVWAVTRYTAILAMAAAFYSGVLARECWNLFVEWSDGYVKRCQQVEVETPVLHPVKPQQTASVEVESDRVLVTQVAAPKAAQRKQRKTKKTLQPVS